jgi:hypothetical protein
MSRSFEQWFNETTKPSPAKPVLKDESDYQDADILHFECGCGKTETVTYGAYMNGDTGWYVEDIEDGKGICGGQFCRP